MTKNQTSNADLLQRLEAVGDGCSSRVDEAAAEISALRSARDDQVAGFGGYEPSLLSSTR